MAITTAMASLCILFAPALWAGGPGNRSLHLLLSGSLFTPMGNHQSSNNS